MKKISDDRLGKFTTSTWFFWMGVSCGLLKEDLTFFWWVPVFLLVCLVIVKLTIYLVDKKVKKREPKSKVNS